MKNKIVILPLIILLLITNFSFASDTLDLLEAKKLKAITLKMEGLGGHSEYCLMISVTNSTKKLIHLIINPGLLMKPVDEQFQDLLVVEKQKLELIPGQKIVSKLRAFCAAHSKHSPDIKSAFYATMGDSKLIQLAEYIDKNPKSGNIQEAVWVVANGTSIASIDKKNTELVKVVSRLSKQPIPDYTVTYANADGVLFSDRASRIKGEVEFTVIGEDMISFQIYDERGRLRKTIYAERLAKRGKHIEEYDIDISKLNKGIYFIKIYQQNQLLSEKRFEI